MSRIRLLRSTLAVLRAVLLEWQNGPRYDGNAANCVTREQADAYCRWSRGPAGSLPTRALWDHAHGRRDIQVRDDTNEWAADDAPGGPAWVRGPRGARGFSWTTAPAAQGQRAVSFRCVVR
jgi:hypothetical protein